MNPLEPYPGARKALYLVQFIIAGMIMIIGVAFTAAGAEFPTWYTVAAAVASALWSYLGLQAAANTPAPGRNERGHADVSLFLGVACLVLLIVVLVRVL